MRGGITVYPHPLDGEYGGRGRGFGSDAIGSLCGIVIGGSSSGWVRVRTGATRALDSALLSVPNLALRDVDSVTIWRALEVVVDRGGGVVQVLNVTDWIGPGTGNDRLQRRRGGSRGIRGKDLHPEQSFPSDFRLGDPPAVTYHISTDLVASGGVRVG